MKQRGSRGEGGREGGPGGRGIDGLVNTRSNGQVKGYKGWMAK